MQKPIRILYFNGGLMNRGGIESYMMNYYRHFDRSKVQIDFAVHDAGGYGYYDEEVKSMGGKIHVLPKKSSHPLTYKSKVKEILRLGCYKIVHTHMDAMGAMVLKVAKECVVPVRIAHSHNTQHLTTNPIKLYFLEKARRNINKYATHRMACSDVAGQWLFGNAPFQVVRNAIDIDKFCFDNDMREKIRREYNVGNAFLIGHVGRFDTQKNHKFLIDVFADVCRKNRNCKLMLIGEGLLQDRISEKIRGLNIEDAVIMTGVQNDVYRFYNAFDLFVLPSLFEGLPVVALESQINGCYTYLSTSITTEVKIASATFFFDLQKDLWSNEISTYIQNHPTRSAAKFETKASGYDIISEAQKLQQFYIDLWNRN